LTVESQRLGGFSSFGAVAGGVAGGIAGAEKVLNWVSAEVGVKLA
jgi:hypothetical protein